MQKETFMPQIIPENRPAVPSPSLPDMTRALRETAWTRHTLTCVGADSVDDSDCACLSDLAAHDAQADWEASSFCALRLAEWYGGFLMAAVKTVDLIAAQTVETALGQQVRTHAISLITNCLANLTV